jgi:hypothetical protein
MLQIRTIFYFMYFFTLNNNIMFTNKRFFADDATGGGATPPAKTKTTGSLPASDVDFMDVSKDVAASWVVNPAITLLWKQSSDFEKEVQDYAASLGSRLSTGSVRPGQTLTLKQLDDKVNEGVTEVKVYIEKKYKKANAQPQFARFGIVKDQTTYRFSKDRNNRKAAFELMIAAIAEDGFGAEEYGTAFWTALQSGYTAALTAASTTTGDVSEKVATKNQQKLAIKKVLTSLLLILKGNYPDTYKEMYRKWGWKKESY